MTAIVKASASGKLAALFVFAAGKNMIESWTKPLLKQYFTDTARGPHCITNKNRLPGDCVIRCTENGSVDKVTMLYGLEDMVRYIRRFVAKDQPVVSLLDAPSSQKGIDGVQYGKTQYHLGAFTCEHHTLPKTL